MGTNSNYALRLPASPEEGGRGGRPRGRHDAQPVHRHSAVAEKLLRAENGGVLPARRAERGDVDAALGFLYWPGGEPPGPGDEVMPG